MVFRIPFIRIFGINQQYTPKLNTPHSSVFIENYDLLKIEGKIGEAAHA